jgi:hypothetical protein
MLPAMLESMRLEHTDSTPAQKVVFHHSYFEKYPNHQSKFR